MPPIRCELGEVLEVGEQRKHHLGPDRGDHELGQHQTQVLDGARAADTAIAYKASRFVVPLLGQEIDRVLEGALNAVIVLWCDKHEAIELCDFSRPHLSVVLGILTKAGRQWFVQKRQIELGDVDEFAAVDQILAGIVNHATLVNPMILVTPGGCEGLPTVGRRARSARAEVPERH